MSIIGNCPDCLAPIDGNEWVHCKACDIVLCPTCAAVVSKAFIGLCYDCMAKKMDQG